MRALGPHFLFSLFVLAAITLACGGSSHTLQSVTVSPATADARDYANGQVQFVATGYYDSAPSPVKPLTTIWGACYQGTATAGETIYTPAIDQSTGVAQCTAQTTPGTYTIFTENPRSDAGANCSLSTSCGGGCFVTGTAQLTCP
jgi:hypothetical protein